MKYAKGCGCAAAGLTLLLAAYSVLIDEPERAMVRLFRGDHRVVVTSVTVHGQQRLVRIEDEESVRYLNAAFRSVVPDDHAHRDTGVVYQLGLRFGYLNAASCYASPGIDAPGMMVWYEESFDRMAYFWVAFPDPMPTPVADMLAAMRAE